MWYTTEQARADARPAFFILETRPGEWIKNINFDGKIEIAQEHDDAIRYNQKKEAIEIINKFNLKAKVKLA